MEGDKQDTDGQQSDCENFIDKNHRKALKEVKKVKKSYCQLYVEYKKEKLIGEEAEKAFYKMMEMYEEKRHDCESMGGIIEGHRQALEVVHEMEEKLCLQKLLTEEKIQELEVSNHKMNLMENILIQEKHKLAKVQRELEMAKTPKFVDHSVCDSLMDQFKGEKENALKQMQHMCEEIEELKEERDWLTRASKEAKTKMKEIVTIKNELVHQNKTLLFQMKGLQNILQDKDEQIKTLASRRNIMEHPAVRDKIRKINAVHTKNRKWWLKKINAKNRKIRKIVTEVEKFRNNAERKIATLINGHVPRKRYDILKKKCERDSNKHEAALANLVVAMNQMNNDLLDMQDASNRDLEKLEELKQEIRAKDIEITVLVEVKKRYEEILRKGNCDPNGETPKKSKSVEKNESSENESSFIDLENGADITQSSFGLFV